MSGSQDSKELVWAIVSAVAQREGLHLFDIEMPQNNSGILRIFIWRSKSENVQLEDCVKVSKSLEDIVELDNAIPGSYVLEVSSPGVNRKLTRPEHFSDAVGERVKVIVDNTLLPKGVIKGKLQAFDGKDLKIADEEEDNDEYSFPFSAVKRANVDFKFGNKRE